MPITASEITDFLRSQESEDPIAGKSKERVLRDMAEGVKKNKALEGGNCNICGRLSEKLLPVPMRVGKPALEEMQRFGGGKLKIVNVMYGPYFCDKTLVKHHQTWYVNPFMCQWCANKLGTFHKYNLDGMRATIKQAEARKNESRQM